MALDIGNAIKSGFASGLNIVKIFVIPMVLGAIVIGIITGAVPATKKFLQ